MFTIPTYPSGLGVVTGLNPDSTILKDDLDKIIQEAFAWELDDFQPKIDDHLHLVANDFDAVARHLDI